MNVPILLHAAVLILSSIVSVAPPSSHRNAVAQPTNLNRLGNLFPCVGSATQLSPERGGAADQFGHPQKRFFLLGCFLLKKTSSARALRRPSSDSRTVAANFLKNSVKRGRLCLFFSFCLGCLRRSALAKSVPHLQLSALLR